MRTSEAEITFVVCRLGHRHWGQYGAAGLLISHGERYLLQHRSAYVDHGLTWSIPGGAMEAGEDPRDTADREATEEFGRLPPYRITHVTVSDCGGGWLYHTVHAEVKHEFTPRGDLTDPDHGENEGYGEWHTGAEIDRLPLHPGFAGEWLLLRRK